MPVKIIVGEDQLKRATIIVSSAIRLVVGGRAMLVKLASNHHTDINGRRGWRSRARLSMRLCVRSSFAFAWQNKRQEVRPWEIMRIIARETDHWVGIIRAVMTRFIWLTPE